MRLSWQVLVYIFHPMRVFLSPPLDVWILWPGHSSQQVQLSSTNGENIIAYSIESRAFAGGGEITQVTEFSKQPVKSAIWNQMNRTKQSEIPPANYPPPTESRLKSPMHPLVGRYLGIDWRLEISFWELLAHFSSSSIKISFVFCLVAYLLLPSFIHRISAACWALRGFPWLRSTQHTKSLCTLGRSKSIFLIVHRKLMMEIEFCRFSSILVKI